MSAGSLIKVNSSWILYNALLCAFIVGWIPRLIFNADIGPFLDFLLFSVSTIVLLSKGMKKTAAAYFLGVGLYALSGLVAAVLIRGVNILDFLVAYKFVWYILILTPLAGREILSPRQLSRLLRISVVGFFLVYTVKFIIGPGRPIFFTENNFELLLICLLFVAAHFANNKTALLDACLLLVIALLSGSRSGAVLVAVAIIFTFDFRKLRNASSVMLMVGGGIGIALAAYVFSTRTTGGVESIDRYMFFLGLVDSVSSWPWWQFFVGAPRITALPVDVCSRLSFYDALFSYSGNGSCYSVVLHSFNMRILFDHGLVVATLCGTLLWKFMAGLPGKAKFCVLLILVLNGLSVSSLNSVYAALGVVFVLSAAARLREGR